MEDGPELPEPPLDVAELEVEKGNLSWGIVNFLGVARSVV